MKIISKIVFKQWIYKPNLKGTPKAVSNMMKYIGTRDGVELGSFAFENEMKALENGETFEKELYTQYIATREGVATGDGLTHGLFGKLTGMKEMDDIADLEKSMKYIEKLAQSKKTIYNAVISMTEEDADFKGMTNRTDWAEFLNNHINDIARAMDINPRTMEWVGAVHMEKGHPHLHLMYWDTAQKIGKNTISAKQSNSIRHKLINDLYKNELTEIRKEKDIQRKSIVNSIHNSDNSILKQAVKTYGSLGNADIYKLAQKNVSKGMILNRSVANKYQKKLISNLLDLKSQIKKEYPTGALKYKYMPKSIKATLKSMADDIITNNPQIAREYDKFVESIKKQAKLYGSGKAIDNYVLKETTKFKTEICNKILFSTKQMQFIEDKKLPNGEKSVEYQQHCNNIVAMNLMQSILNIVADKNNKSSNTNSKTFGRDLSKAEKMKLAKNKKDISISWDN